MWNQSSRKSSKKYSYRQAKSDDAASSEAASFSATGKNTLTSAQQAYNYALNLLSYRDYSVQKMLEKLWDRGASEEHAREAVNKLLHYNLLNEERYAQRVYEAWLNKRVYGRQHLAMELAKRGVRADCRQMIMEQFTPALEQEHAQQAAAVFAQRNRRKFTEQENDYRKIYAAAARFLAARGFSGKYISELLEKLHDNNNI